MRGQIENKTARTTEPLLPSGPQSSVARAGVPVEAV